MAHWDDYERGQRHDREPRVQKGFPIRVSEELASELRWLLLAELTARKLDEDTTPVHVRSDSDGTDHLILGEPENERTVSFPLEPVYGEGNGVFYAVLTDVDGNGYDGGDSYVQSAIRNQAEHPYADLLTQALGDSRDRAPGS